MISELAGNFIVFFSLNSVHARNTVIQGDKIDTGNPDWKKLLIPMEWKSKWKVNTPLNRTQLMSLDLKQSCDFLVLEHPRRFIGDI